jgi:hypothetical protein
MLKSRSSYLIPFRYIKNPVNGFIQIFNTASVRLYMPEFRIYNQAKIDKNEEAKIAIFPFSSIKKSFQYIIDTIPNYCTFNPLLALISEFYSVLVFHLIQTHSHKHPLGQ